MFHYQVIRGVGAVIVAAAMAGIVGCAGQNTTPTAAAPAATAAPASPVSGAPTGATISGTVVGVVTASSVGARAISLTVTVTGSGSSSTVDNNGHFTLTNVPAGHVDLHFMGNAVDAHLGLDDVSEHATIVITVRVSGNHAQLEDEHGDDENENEEPDDEVELEGTIASGSIAGSCATTVKTNAATKFEDVSCASLKAGDSVEVKGTRQNDSSVVASRVERKDD